MKLNKKFLSCFMAATMAIAPMSAFAANDASIQGIGDISAINPDIYNVILPTSDSVSFHVDPTGILALPDSGETLKEVLSNAAGTVTSSATAIINMSSIDIDVNIEATVAVSGSANYTLNLAKDKASVSSKATAAGLYLAVTPITGAVIHAVESTTQGALATNISTISDKAAVLSESTIYVTGAGCELLSSDALAVTASSGAAKPSSKKISLKGIPEAYKVLSTGSVTLSDTAMWLPKNTHVFAVTGYADPKTEVWKKLSDEDAELVLNIKFSFDKKADSYVNVTSISASSNQITLSMPDGVNIASVSVLQTGGTTLAWTRGDQYTINNNTMTVLATPINYNHGSIMTITYSNGVTDTINIE